MTLRRDLPGLAVALVVAAIGMGVHEMFDVLSPHVVAVAFGVAAATMGLVSDVLRPGLRLAARRVLRIGIVLLGFRLSLSELGELGPAALASVAIVVVATFFGTQWLARRLGLSPSLGLLVATGYSICGASAIAAVEPFADASEEEVAYSIALVTMCGTLAIVILPSLGTFLGMSPGDFGSWVGASVHDVGQVVAAASTHGSEALKAAVVVKLVRVALLAPLLAAIAVSRRRRTVVTSADAGAAVEIGAPSRRPPILPLFIVLFLVAVAIRSSGVVPDSAADEVWGRLKSAETLLLAMGLAGLGSNVDIRALRRVGGRPLLLGLASWALVAVVSVAAVALTAAA